MRTIRMSLTPLHLLVGFSSAWQARQFRRACSDDFRRGIVGTSRVEISVCSMHRQAVCLKSNVEEMCAYITSRSWWTKISGVDDEDDRRKVSAESEIPWLQDSASHIVHNPIPASSTKKEPALRGTAF